MKGHTMKKVVVGLVLALTVAACSAPTTPALKQAIGFKFKTSFNCWITDIDG
jgi:uncharacterized lipoprotein